ncbi:MAG: hypothetical protein EZS28_035304 [Streblomastix strix]|uniref:Uncharacterized protein n=1 Tax=Streblomastix strix TaxID=222440 RepID=A0A5J4UEZ3_9EUKA|nr:MAG: hypothetical protein EZS28_035304 [Streblomastix strix]
MRLADEFTQNMDSKITLPVVIPFIQQLLQSQQYILRSTGHLLLSAIIEGSREQLQEKAQQDLLLQMATQSIQGDPSNRVVHSAIQTLGSLCRDLNLDEDNIEVETVDQSQNAEKTKSFFSSIYAQEIMQSIIIAIKGVDIDDGGGQKVRRNPCFPVQLMACRMTTTFSDNVSKSILKENCQILVQVIFELLYQNQQYITEMANSESEKNNELQRIQQQLLTSSTTQLDEDIANTKFSNKLKAAYKIRVQSAIALTTLFDRIEEGCEQYFSVVCPIVMSGLIGEGMSRIVDIGTQIACVASQQDKEYQSACIDCVMALFSGIGKEKAGQYLNQFMDEIIKIEKEMIFDPNKSQLQLNQQQQQQSSDQTSSLQHKIYKDESDPRIRSIESLYVRLADLVKEQFVPLLEFAMKPLLRKAQKRSGIRVLFSEQSLSDNLRGNSS